ncbi:gp090 [Rhodococcus phage ReqiDocB7]|uniref:gp090 n=1 Tax=Rhodococcus phage ReqiDocB7 TaxID=691966 RepID=UPI0001CDD873|nr:gp090 [Rhodococcus phage ReqiDocB7]ADD80876.1 gp090 [Rhodococcus phage ReqiDocB7]
MLSVQRIETEADNPVVPGNHVDSILQGEYDKKYKTIRVEAIEYDGYQMRSRSTRMAAEARRLARAQHPDARVKRISMGSESYYYDSPVRGRIKVVRTNVNYSVSGV